MLNFINTSRHLLTALVSFAGFTPAANAAEFYTSDNVGGGRLNLFFRGFADETYIGAQGTITSSVMMSIDWTAATASVQSFNLAFSGATYTLSHVYTTGPGQTQTVTASVNVDPFTLSAASLPTYRLTPAANGRYDASTVRSGAWMSLPLSGNVSIQGPTQSAIVPFSLSIPVSANLGFPALFGLETANYPTTVSLDLFDTSYDGGGTLLGYWFTPNVSVPWRLAQATVDGINVDIGTIGGMSATFGEFDLHAVPEPSSSLILLLGAGVLVRRRMAREIARGS
jgi:hypothetical protein